MQCLELLYQDLRCEYHLVQGESRDRPYIPALTTDGFVNWMSAFIQASPGSEARRLDGIMATLPIDADSETPSDKPERLPKQLSRHLFPSKPHESTRQCVSSALKVWYDALGLSSSRPPSYLGAFRNLFARSLSPKPRDRGRREDRSQGSAAREDRETFIEVIEVPPSHSSNSQRSSRSYHRTRDWDEHSTRSLRSSRSSGKVLVEEASRHSRAESPRRRQHRHHHRREGSPRPSKHQSSRHDENRRVESRDSRRSAASEYASSQPRTTPPSSREGSPKALTNRAENYAFFQGRESGSAHEGILRETPATKRTQRASRH